MREFYVYIMTNKSRTLYTGMTNNLERRVFEHKHKLTAGFTSKYNITRLVHYEVFGDVRDAIAREKQIKGWLRAKKVALIETSNPEWKDLAEAWTPRHSERVCHSESSMPRAAWKTQNDNPSRDYTSRQSRTDERSRLDSARRMPHRVRRTIPISALIAND